MTWLNPWAWIGLAAIAVPVLVHLLARRPVRPVLFPTLRFFGPPRTLLARRDRLTDLALLAVRAGIVASAVAALAQPYVLTGRRAQDLAGTIARAVVVDASASMARAVPAGGTALEAARREAQRLTSDATASSVGESARPARTLEGAVAWLVTQTGNRELIVISDFQLGAIAAADLAGVPPDVGVRLVRINININVTPGTTPLEVISTAAGLDTTARVTLTPSELETTVEWTSRGRSSNAPNIDTWPELVANDAERPYAEAALEAARAVGAPPLPARRSVAVVFPGAAERARLLAEAAPLSEPWMFDAIDGLRQDQSIASPFDHVARTVFRSSGRDRLIVFASSEPGHVASAALIAGVLRALSPATPPNEMDPSVVPDDTLRQWQRAPGPISAPRQGDAKAASDGRWFWGLALALLVVETWMRRRSPSDAAQHTPEAPHARVA